MDNNNKKLIKESQFIQNDPVEIMKFNGLKNYVNIIANWAGVESFDRVLGNGFYGVAYATSDPNIVIKFTQDATEAKSASTIIGDNLPNVYHIYKVGKLIPENKKTKDPRKDLRKILSKDISKDIYVLVINYVEEVPIEVFQAVELIPPEYLKYLDSMYITLDHKKFYELIRTYQSIYKGKEKELMTKYYRREYNIIAFVMVMSMIGGEPYEVDQLDLFLKEELSDPAFEMTNTHDIANIALETEVELEELGYIWQVFSGTNALKRSGITFDDVHPGNVGIGPDGEIQIIDIGVSLAKRKPHIDQLKMLKKRRI